MLQIFCWKHVIVKCVNSSFHIRIHGLPCTDIEHLIPHQKGISYIDIRIIFKIAHQTAFIAYVGIIRIISPVSKGRLLLQRSVELCGKDHIHTVCHFRKTLAHPHRSAVISINIIIDKCQIRQFLFQHFKALLPVAGCHIRSLVYPVSLRPETPARREGFSHHILIHGLHMMLVDIDMDPELHAVFFTGLHDRFEIIFTALALAHIICVQSMLRIMALSLVAFMHDHLLKAVREIINLLSKIQAAHEWLLRLADAVIGNPDEIVFHNVIAVYLCPDMFVVDCSILVVNRSILVFILTDCYDC